MTQDKKTYLFNPENDMALAVNKPYYKPPKEIIRMAYDLGSLPAWYCDEGDVVKVEDEDMCSSFQTLCGAYGVQPFGSCVSHWLNMEYVPWGWNCVLTHELSLHHVDACFYPDEEKMNAIRVLSGRQQAMYVLSRLHDLSDVCGESFVAKSRAEVSSLHHTYSRIIIKSPWSGSGRGLVKIDSAPIENSVLGWIDRILRTQGCVMVEPLYNKVCDFAMEFFADKNGKVRGVGYSLFETDVQGNYKCNVMADDAWIIKKLSDYVPELLLHKVQHRLESILSELIRGAYHGYLGVDMMICIHGGKYYLHPCVEINLRMNMGVVARLLYDRYMENGIVGQYVVEHFWRDGEALLFMSEMEVEHPCTVCNGKLIKGYLPLTPISEFTRFHIYILA